MKNGMARLARPLIALLALALCLAPLCGAGAEEIYTVKIDVGYGQSEARTLLDMVNSFRTGSDAWYWNSDNSTKTVCTDLQPLTYDYGLERIAMQRAAEIAVYYDHTRPDMSLCWEADSLSPAYYNGRGENIAAGYETASSVFVGWREDDDSYSGQGHRRNMLSSGFNAFGAACVHFNEYEYWVQEFGYTSSPVTEQTAANDSQTEATVQIADSALMSVKASADAVELEYGDSAALPAASARLRTKETWPSRLFPANVECAWAVQDESVVSLSSGRLTALRVGETNLTCTLFGREVSVPVTVTAKDISKANVELDIPEDPVPYAGEAISPAVLRVTCGERTLTPETDYTVSYENNDVPGTARVRIAGCGNYRGAAVKEFEIVAIEPTAISITPADVQSLNLEDTLQLSAALEPANAWSRLKWSSSKPKIAKVGADGLVTGLAEGEAVISVTADNGLTAKLSLIVVDPYKPTAIALEPSGEAVVNLGEPMQLTATLAPETARSDLKWSTSNKKIAKISATGLLTPVKTGKATITVRAVKLTAAGQTLTAKLAVRVVDPTLPTGVTLEPSGNVTINKGETLALTATLAPETARSNLKWSTSNKKVAAVRDGVITAKKAGSAKITVATRNGKKATLKVKVVDPTKATSVTLDHTELMDLPLGQTLQLTATMQPETATGKLRWTSSNTKVAKVSATGLVTPKKKGSVKITVKTNNGKTASVKIRVVAALPVPEPTPEATAPASETPTPVPEPPTPEPETTAAPPQEQAEVPGEP